jgi:DNA gyrase subunit A
MDENIKDTNLENNEEFENVEIEAGGVEAAEISSEMERAFLDYAMSVIVSRSLPDIRDGLKPVQRRIIYAMKEQGMTPDARFSKCAAVVGEVLKSYHPHGDMSVYEALVRMAQDFSLRYPLILGQGNFGNIDGDGAAAMRYTEAKMSKIAEELLRDIDKDTVNFEINDLQNEEPLYLPSAIPNILLNGALGIAVGMATNIPPHNLAEVCDGINELIEKADNIGEAPDKDDKEQIAKPSFESSATVEELVKHIKGPDFPTGGIIYDQKDIMQIYSMGRGRVVARAKMSIEEDKKGKTSIIVTEIPYQVNKSTLIEKIADCVKDKKIIGISDLRDETNKLGIRIVIELKKDAIPQKIQNQLYKYTQLQTAFNANMVMLVGGEPKVMGLKAILEEFVKHRQLVVIRRTKYLLKKAQDREHILLGLKKAVDFIDEVIKIIRGAKDTEEAKANLIKRFEFSDIQAQAILDLQLRRLSALERYKIEEELNQIQAIIKDCKDLLASPKRIIDEVKRENQEIKEKYKDERRTKVVKGKLGELTDEDLVVNEPCIISISESGYIKRLKPDTYKKQGRGGKGVSGQTLREEDNVDQIRICSTHDFAMFFTNKGKVYKLKVMDIPESSRTAKGTAIVNFLNITQDEKVEEFITASNDIFNDKNCCVVLATTQGKVKKTSIEEFSSIRNNGIIAINLTDGDSLIAAKLSCGDDDIILVSDRGQSIRFAEEDVRPMGRSASGVAGVKLLKEHKLIAMDIISKAQADASLVVVTEFGYGKKTLLDEYKSQTRAGSGIITYKVSDKTGKVVATRVVDKAYANDVLLASKSGKIIRLDYAEIPEMGRSTIGVRLIKLDSGDSLVGAAFMDASEELVGMLMENTESEE